MNQSCQQSGKIAVIGAGLSGTLVAANLLRVARQPQTIYLIERSATIGRGVAYGTSYESHLLNVPAGKMGAWPDSPGDFLRWMQQSCRLPGVDAATFAPRRLYGEYIQDMLDMAEREAAPGVRLERVCDEAVGVYLEETPPICTVALHHGEIRVRSVVLALGNFPPSDPWVADPSFYNSPRYVRSAWSQQALQFAPHQSVMLIGAGLTMLDMVNALIEQDHQGPIHAISRRGLLPRSHRPSAPYPPFLDSQSLPRTIRALMRRVRSEVRHAAAQGIDWRPVLDSLRPLTQSIWQALPCEERRRFLRHARCYWEMHRHRAPQAASRAAQELIASGQLQLHAGRIMGYREDPDGVTVSYRPRSTASRCEIQVEKVINCTGPCSDYLKQPHPLIQALQGQGLIRPDTLRLGLDVTTAGALIDVNGHPSEVLFTLGSLCKGALWETTAVPEIREQAAALARKLAATSV